MSSPATTPTPRRITRLVPILVAILVAGIGVAAYLLYPRPPQPMPEPDMIGAMAANARGVGRMDRYEYLEAEAEFAEAVRLAPDWQPAKINLGIALMNQQPDQEKDLATPAIRAAQLFRVVLEKDPDNKHAHYCLGIMAEFTGEFPKAYQHFAAVNKLDPDDAHTWLRLGACHPSGQRSPDARNCFEQALKLNPYLNEARYRLFQALVVSDPERAKLVVADFERFRKSDWETLSRIDRYSEMGKYGDAIGRDTTLPGNASIGPLPVFEVPAGFHVALAAGAKWATLADLDPIRRDVRTRFGATIVLFDFNRDGKPDIFIPSAVLENGKIRDLLLRNDGNHKFTDVTVAAGLGTPRVSLGVAAADYDNDGFPDLVVTGAGEQHLFRNRGDGTFDDVSAAAGLDKVTGICLGCGWVDLDQDCDLDLILCRYSATFGAGEPLSPAAMKGGGIVLLENVGEARPMPPGGHAVPLTTKFIPDVRLSVTSEPCAAVSFIAADLDGDQDIDLLVLADGSSPFVLENDRLMRFHRTAFTASGDKAGRWNGGLAFVASHADRADMFLVRPNAAPQFLMAKGMREFAPGSTNGPPLKQAHAVDLDLDGWPDILGLAADSKPVLLHNQGDGRLEHKPAAFGDVGSATGIACADLDGDGNPDLLVLSESGLSLLRNVGNGNKAIAIDPTGRRDPGTVPTQRTNADGIGCWIVAQAGPHWTAAERTTSSAGLGQSLLPTLLGLGKAGQADVVRLRWPDGSHQAELGVNSGSVVRIVENNRKSTSCPILMTWDGEKFAYVTDILGAGSMGESGPDGSTRPPRPEESIKIEAGFLKPKNGHYVLKLAEPMDEVLYLDHLRLDVIDHPADAVVFPDERFATADPQPTQEILTFRHRYFPKIATEHRGGNVTERLLERDRRFVDGFHLRSWIGFAEEHTLTLDFGDIPVDRTRWYLVMAGWTDYAYPESIYAAERAGVPVQFPVLERLAADGKIWEPVGDLGFPAGLPRVMTRPLPNFRGGKCSLRIRTNLQIFWDQIYLSPVEEIGIKVHSLDIAGADLVNRGFMREIHPDGRLPLAYDDARTESVPVTKWNGNLTRLGDVTDLLRAADDRFVLCGPGDEITVRFDAMRLPVLAEGCQRSFVLRSRGYCKDAAPTTQTGGQIGPLPFRAMTNYPDFGGMKPPVTDAEVWHTRPASGR